MPHQGDPGIEFKELREFYSGKARRDPPLTGFTEFKQARAARVWPGAARFRDAVLTLAENDFEWLRHKRPGLRRFIAERMWEMKPRANPSHEPPGAPPKTPEQIEREKEKAKTVLNQLRDNARREAAEHRGKLPPGERKTAGAAGSSSFSPSGEYSPRLRDERAPPAGRFTGNGPHAAPASSTKMH